MCIYCSGELNQIGLDFRGFDNFQNGHDYLLDSDIFCCSFKTRICWKYWWFLLSGFSGRPLWNGKPNIPHIDWFYLQFLQKRMLFFENVCPKVPYISDFYHYTNSVFVCFLSFIVQLYMFTCSFIHDYRSSYLFVVCVCNF